MCRYTFWERSISQDPSRKCYKHSLPLPVLLTASIVRGHLVQTQKGGATSNASLGALAILAALPLQAAGALLLPLPAELGPSLLVGVGLVRHGAQIPYQTGTEPERL
jgi:hypothetical protein